MHKKLFRAIAPLALLASCAQTPPKFLDTPSLERKISSETNSECLIQLKSIMNGESPPPLINEKASKPAFTKSELEKLMMAVGKPPKLVNQDAIPVERVNIFEPELNDWEKYDGKEVGVIFDRELLTFSQASATEMIFGDAAYGTVRLKVNNTDKMAEDYGPTGNLQISKLINRGLLAARRKFEIGMFIINFKDNWYFSDIIEGEEKSTLSVLSFQKKLSEFLRNHPEIDTKTSSIHVIHSHPRPSPFNPLDVKAMPEIIKFVNFAEVKGIALDASGNSVPAIAFTYTVPKEVIESVKNPENMK